MAEKTSLGPEQNEKLTLGDTSTVYVSERIVKERGHSSASEVPLWLISFTDVMALMLTFFVLLYSMSVPEEDKWEEVTAAFGSEFQEKYSKPYSKSGVMDAIQIDKVRSSRALNVDYLQGIIEDLLAHEKIDNVLVVKKNEGLIVSLPDALLFGKTQAELQVKGKRILFLIAGTMSRVKNKMDVVGHIDPALAHGAADPYPSGWALSLGRAGVVASFLREAGYSRPLIMHGSSSVRYDDLPADLAEEKRVDLSRRVDLFITKEGGAMRSLLRIEGRN